MAPACEQFATMNAPADNCDAGHHTAAGVEKSVGRQTDLKPRYRNYSFVHYLPTLRNYAFPQVELSNV